LEYIRSDVILQLRIAFHRQLNVVLHNKPPCPILEKLFEIHKKYLIISRYRMYINVQQIPTKRPVL